MKISLHRLVSVIRAKVLLQNHDCNKEIFRTRGIGNCVLDSLGALSDYGVQNCLEVVK